MKDKILLFIIGVLVGAVIATGAFYVYSKSTSNCSNETTTQSNDNRPEMPGGQMGENGQPPEMPSGERPDMANNSNTQSKTDTEKSN